MYIQYRSATNVISAILNVGQDVDEDWPLFVKVGIKINIMYYILERSLIIKVSIFLIFSRIMMEKTMLLLCNLVIWFGMSQPLWFMAGHTL